MWQLGNLLWCIASKCLVELSQIQFYSLIIYLYLFIYYLFNHSFIYVMYLLNMQCMYLYILVSLWDIKHVPQSLRYVGLRVTKLTLVPLPHTLYPSIRLFKDSGYWVNKPNFSMLWKATNKALSIISTSLLSEWRVEV